ncbi:M48 family metallopeptidase [Saccharopolyspora sp. ID03-671]|uniref:M48 family metallopeptidase n=1 Tax=Saccharopolyspora sp. ID03-671 TaxID=3073066 RepID=UPI00324C6A21
MRGPWRAALALALHIGFFVVSLGLVAGLLMMAGMTFRRDTVGGLKVAFAALVVGATLLFCLRAVLRNKVRPRGVPLDRVNQPNLWRTIDQLVDATDSPLPDEIRITSEPSVTVREDTALLGLRTRTRYLEIGLPMLAALTTSELGALLAHAVGRLTGRSRLAVTAHRVLASVRRTRDGLTAGPVKWLFAGYARVFTAIAVTTTKELVLAGDAAAVRVAGKRTAVMALRKSVAVELGWQDYTDEYLSMAATIGHAPDVLLGFRSFMDHPTRKPALAERAKVAIAEETGELPVRTRVEMMKRLKSADKEVDERPAFAILRKPRNAVPELEDHLLVDSLGPRMPWPDVVRKAGAAQSAEKAAQLSAAAHQCGLGVDPTIQGVLVAIHRGHGRDLVNPVLNPGLHPSTIDQAAEDTLTDLLGCTVVDALVCAGRAHHELDWGGPPGIRLANGRPIDPDRLVRPAVADPRLIPGLHRVLVDLGVPLRHTREPAEEPEPVLSGIVSPVLCSGESYDLLVTDRGLLLLPSDASAAKRLLAGTLAMLREAEEEQLSELASRPIAELRERSGAQWVDSRDVASARLDQDKTGWSLELDLYLDEYAMSALDDVRVVPGRDEGVSVLTLRSTADGVEHGEPYHGLSELMGARMELDEPALSLD